MCATVFRFMHVCAGAYRSQERHGPPGAGVTSSCGCGAEAELGCFGYPQVLQSSLCSEYCPNLYIYHIKCVTSFKKSMLEQNH